MLAIVVLLAAPGCKKADTTETNDPGAESGDAGSSETQGIEISIVSDPSWEFDHPVARFEGDGLEESVAGFVAGTGYLLNADLEPVAAQIAAAFLDDNLDSTQCVQVSVEGQGEATLLVVGGQIQFGVVDGPPQSTAAMGLPMRMESPTMGEMD